MQIMILSGGGGKSLDVIYKLLGAFINRYKKSNGLDYLDICAKQYQGKIVWNRISQELCFSYDDKGYMILDSMFMITCSNHVVIKFLLALLNSSLSKYWIKNNAATLGDGIYGAKIYIEKIPIPKIDSKNKEVTEKIIILVNEILLQKLASKSTEEVEKQIDALVYQLYGLNDDEIKAIELEFTKDNMK